MLVLFPCSDGLDPSPISMYLSIHGLGLAAPDEYLRNMEEVVPLEASNYRFTSELLPSTTNNKL